MTRQCRKCKLIADLPNKEWRGIKSGIRIVCKTCYYIEYAEDNKESVAKNKMDWIKADPGRFSKTQARYKESGKAGETLKSRIAKDPIGFSRRAVERANKAKENNPEKYLAYQAAYQRVRRKILRHPINYYYLTDLVPKYAGCPEELTVDHIIPLKSDLVSGLHVPWNIQYLTQKNNSKKSNSFDGTYNNEGWKNA